MSVPYCDVYFSEKNPYLGDFACYIKNTPELLSVFESVQKDSTGGHADILMDLELNW